MSLLFLYGIVSIFFSFVCSILEAVLLSVTPTFINLMKKEGKAFALPLEAFKKDVDKPLIAILTLNTVAHTVGAILVGVQAKVAYAELYGTTTRTIFGLHLSEDIMVGIVSTIMTILILVASEIIPKTIGATYWKQLAGFTTSALKVLIFPLKWTGMIWLLQLTTKLIGGKGHGSILSREDFHAMTDIAEEEGVFEESESLVIKNLLNFKLIRVKDVMTPRTVIHMASEDTKVKSFFDENKDLAREFGVRSIPTLIYFSNGKEVKRSSGVLSENQLGAAVAGLRAHRCQRRFIKPSRRIRAFASSL